MKKNILIVIIGIVLCFYIGYEFGTENAENKIQENYLNNFEKAKINDCNGRGCYISIPSFDEDIYATCDENHTCSRSGKTQADIANDEKEGKMWEEALKNIPEPIE